MPRGAPMSMARCWAYRPRRVQEGVRSLPRRRPRRGSGSRRKRAPRGRRPRGRIVALADLGRNRNPTRAAIRRDSPGRPCGRRRARTSRPRLAGSPSSAVRQLHGSTSAESSSARWTWASMPKSTGRTGRWRVDSGPPPSRWEADAPAVGGRGAGRRRAGVLRPYFGEVTLPPRGRRSWPSPAVCAGAAYTARHRSGGNLEDVLPDRALWTRQGRARPIFPAGPVDDASERTSRKSAGKSRNTAAAGCREVGALARSDYSRR